MVVDDLDVNFYPSSVLSNLLKSCIGLKCIFFVENYKIHVRTNNVFSLNKIYNKSKYCNIDI